MEYSNLKQIKEIPNKNHKLLWLITYTFILNMYEKKLFYIYHFSGK